MKVNKVYLYGLSILSLAFFACSNDNLDNPAPEIESVDKTADISSDANIIKLTKSQEETAAACRDFSLNVFNTIDTANENVILSPLSLSTAMSMLANGAQDETLAEILIALGYQGTGMSLDKLNDHSKIIIYQLTGVDKNVKLAMANSLWTDSSFPIKDSFQEDLRSLFSAESFTLNLRSDEARKTINGWCSDKTNGNIPEFLQENLDNDVALINAIDFKADWAQEFINFNTDNFNNHDGSVSKVEMMCSENEYRYTEVAGVKAIEIPYATGAYAMKVIIPQSLSFTLNTESLFTIDKALYDGEKSLVKLAFPSFEIRTRMSLTDALKSMGIKRVFTTEAQLKKISDAKAFYLDKVLQQAVIATDCKGTSATAVTMIALETSASPEDVISPVELTVNQPFYFLIEEKSSGTILFVGHVSKL